MGAKFDALLGALREKDTGTNTLTVTEYDNADPVSPTAGTIWVKRTFTPLGNPGDGMGLLLALTYSGVGASTYELSYKTNENTIIRTVLS